MNAEAPRTLAPAPGEIAVAAVVPLPFVMLLTKLFEVAAPLPEQRIAADPLIRLLDAWGGAWLAIPVVSATCLTWAFLATPSREELRRGLRLALIGALAATFVALALRLVVGDTLPAAIPPEESAKPGLALGLAAGTLEEALFRLIAMPVLLALFARRLGAAAAAAIAVAATGFLFALSHQLGPDASFVPHHFAIRALLPGALFSALFLRPGPAFIVSAHATAHLWIPALFR